MLAPKCATYHGRSTFANPKYCKKAQSNKPCLYEIPYDTSDPANRFAPDGEDTVTLEKESRSKLDKDKVKPYNYTYQNSLYETFKPPSKAYLDQLERAKEVRKTMWRKTSNHTSSAFPNPTAKSMEVLIKILLMPLSDKTILDSHCFIHELKREMNDDLEYVNSLEKELDELESEKADFSNIYDLLLEECVSKDVTCSYLHSLSDLNANTELQCLYLHKVKECECLAQKLSKQTESVNKEVHNNLLYKDTKATLGPNRYGCPKIRKANESTSCFQKLQVFCERSSGKHLLTGSRGSISTQYLFKKQLHQLQYVAWLKLHQLKHGYGIEGFLILTSDYITLLSKKEDVQAY
ncbi:hypothetical protein Tco_0728942 [Tanacetum coccineum]|uniref:Uncharacterized protein n=1 Tax=Tanacetum coccineum TaxID=301880 RepID=A0ABQ4YNR5_9ASTR